MRSEKPKSNRITYSLLTILILLVGVALYFYLLKPELDLRDALRDKYNYQQTYVDEVTDQFDKVKNTLDRAKPLKELEMKIPTTNDLQGIMDDIEEAEYGSSTAVTDIQFNNYENANDFAAPLEKDSALTEEELLNPINDGLPVSKIASKEKPKQLNLLTIELSVSGYNANDINKFLKKIEKLQRVYVVDSVNYSNPNVEDGVITASIQLTTFSANIAGDAKKEKNEPATDVEKKDEKKDDK